MAVCCLLGMHHPLLVLSEVQGCSWGEGREGLDPILILLTNRHWVLSNTMRRRQNSFLSSCAFGGGAAGTASCCAVPRAAVGTPTRLSRGSAFKPDWVHWVYRRPCRCPFLKGALLFHGNDLWSPNVFI